MCTLVVKIRTSFTSDCSLSGHTMAGVAVIMQRLGWLLSKIWSCIMFIIGVLHQIAETNAQYQRQHVRDYNSSNLYSLGGYSVSMHHQTNNPSRHSEYTEYYGYNQQSTGNIMIVCVWLMV